METDQLLEGRNIGQETKHQAYPKISIVCRCMQVSPVGECPCLDPSCRPFQKLEPSHDLRRRDQLLIFFVQVRNEVKP